MAKQDGTQMVVVDRLWRGQSGVAPWLRMPGTIDRGLNARMSLSTGGAADRNATELVFDMSELTVDAHWNAIRGAIVAIDENGSVYGWDEQGELSVEGELDLLAEYLTASDDTDSTEDFSNIPINTRIASAVSFNTMVVVNRIRKTRVLDAFTFQESLNFLLTGDKDDGSHGHTASQGSDVDDWSKLFSGEFGSGGTEPAAGTVLRTIVGYELNPAGYYIWIGEEPHENYPEGYFPRHGNWFRIPNENGNANREGRYDEESMPHRIVYEKDERRLVVESIRWRQRVTGNNQTVAPLRWAGSPIKTVEFFSSRLFLISDEQVTASRKGDYFNLWVDDVNAIGDDDRISEDITTTNVGSVLRSAICGRSILVIAENKQMEYTAGDQQLTNINGRVFEKTSHRVRDVEPASEAGVVVVIDELGDLHQYNYLNVDVGVVYTGLLNIHDRKVLYGKSIISMVMVDNTTYVMTDDGMLVHEAFYDSEQMVQSAWSEFRVYERPVFLSPWAGSIYMVTREDGTDGSHSLLRYTHREVPPLDDMLYMPALDRMEVISPSEMTYNPTTDRTTVIHTGRIGDMDLSAVMLPNHYWIKPANINDDGDPEFEGDLTESEVHLGFLYESHIVLSPLYPGQQPNLVGLKNLYVFHHETSAYSMLFTYDGTDYRKEWSSNRSGETVVGQASLSTHFAAFTMHGDPRRTRITLTKTSPARVTWTGVTYELSIEGVRA